MQTLKLPAAVAGMVSGTVTRWLKREGEAVASGEGLVELETERAIILVQSAGEGILAKILAVPGTTVQVDGALAELGSAASASPAPQTSSPPAASPAGVIPILMPQAGQSMEEGTLVKWMVSQGERIKRGQVIFVIETDKAAVDVEATDEGRLARIAVGEGQTVPVKAPVAYLAENDADVLMYLAAQPASAMPSASPAARTPDVQSQPAAPQPTATLEGGRAKASPAARKIASQRGVDLSSIASGTGPGGRILSTDVPAAAPSGAGRRTMSSMRRAIAKNLLLSKQTIPHFYVRMTVRADGMMDLYRQEKAKYPCSLNDLVIMAAARALREFPNVRSRLEGDQIVELPAVNVGIAVGIDEGLIVPVILNAGRLDLQQIGAEARRVAESARKGKIENMGQGVFTITNLGMFGVEEFAAIINPPEAAILAVGAVREDILVENGIVKPARLMTLTLSCDHRLIDGLAAAKFLSRIKELLETPSSLTSN